MQLHWKTCGSATPILACFHAAVLYVFSGSRGATATLEAKTIGGAAMREVREALSTQPASWLMNNLLQEAPARFNLKPSNI